MTDIDDNIWNKCRARIKEKVSSENYSTWFEPVRLHSITAHELILTVPNTFYKDCLEQNYLDMMQSALDSYTQATIKISFTLEGNTLNQQHEPAAPPPDHKQKNPPFPLPLLFPRLQRSILNIILKTLSSDQATNLLMQRLYR